MQTPDSSQLHTRLRVLAALVVVMLLALFSRLWYLQVLAAERYGELAEGNRARQVVVDAPRGRILDRKGRVIVDNRAAWAVTVKVEEMGERRDEVLTRLGQVLGIARKDIEAKLRDYTGSPLRGVPVAEDVDVDQLFYLVEHASEFPGVATEVLAPRHYPHGTLAAHLLGYVAEISGAELETERYQGYKQGDLIGKSGVELTYDRWLRGTDGARVLEVNASGEVIRTLDTREPVPGHDLRLTIDLEVQKLTEKALAEGMKVARTITDSQRGGTYPAPAATAVVLDPDNGDLIALSSLPKYDPRRFAGGISKRDFAAYNKDPRHPLLHRAVQSVYPPGSTWKPFTALAGLRTGKVTPETRINCPGSYRFGNTVKNDWTPRGHGSVDLQRSIQISCDVYYYDLGAKFARAEAAQRAADQEIAEEMQVTARSFGFGSAPQLDLPYAAAGTVPDRAWRKAYWEENKDTYCKGTSALYKELCTDGWRWPGGLNLNMAIGQGDLQVSPLQLALGYAAIANGGTVYAPHVADAVLDRGGGKVVRDVKPKVAMVAKATPNQLAEVRAGLAAVPAGGTASSAFAGFPLDRHPVAGKTGTADLPPKAPFAWFASYAPVGDPEYVVVVMVEQGGHGGQTAAPVARAIYEKLFNLPVGSIGVGVDQSG